MNNKNKVKSLFQLNNYLVPKLIMNKHETGGLITPTKITLTSNTDEKSPMKQKYNLCNYYLLYK